MIFIGETQPNDAGWYKTHWTVDGQAVSKWERLPNREGTADGFVGETTINGIDYTVWDTGVIGGNYKYVEDMPHHMIDEDGLKWGV